MSARGTAGRGEATRNVRTLRITVGLIAFLGALVTSLEALAGDDTVRDRPNVLVLLTDDQQWNAMGALCEGRVRTPTLDRLLAEGFHFRQAYVMGSWHGAVCQPSRAMMLTGRTLWHVKPDLEGSTTWPQLMREAGYVTFGCGKWHNGRSSFARSFERGGHVFFGGMGDHFALPVHRFDAEGRYPREDRRPARKFSSELFADDVIEFLLDHDGTRPFFAWVAFTAPHDPRTAPEAWANAYDPATESIPPNFLPEHPFDNGELRVRDEMLAAFPRTEAVVREHLAAYHAIISHLDAQLGRILEALERSGQAGRTIVVFASDNGLAIGQHGLLGKQSLYEHSARVPLVLRGPGVPSGRRSDALCYLMDVLPTVLGLAGLPVPDQVEGTSLTPVLGGERTGVRDSIFCAYRDLQRMVRDDRYKLIRYDVEGRQRVQLFDLVEDPWERTDLAGEASAASIRARMEALLEGWRSRTDDPTLSR
jgi:arylsulfatase A-like enzyme